MNGSALSPNTMLCTLSSNFITDPILNIPKTSFIETNKLNTKHNESVSCSLRSGGDAVFDGSTLHS